MTKEGEGRSVHLHAKIAAARLAGNSAALAHYEAKLARLGPVLPPALAHYEAKLARLGPVLPPAVKIPPLAGQAESTPESAPSSPAVEVESTLGDKDPTLVMQDRQLLAGLFGASTPIPALPSAPEPEPEPEPEVETDPAIEPEPAPLPKPKPEPEPRKSTTSPPGSRRRDKRKR